MKFKSFILESSDIQVKNIINEAESTVIKLRTLYDVHDYIQEIDLADLFTNIRKFMKTDSANMKISEMIRWANDIKQRLESNIQLLLNIKKSLKTKYLDSLIVQSDKLINNIKDHISINKMEYDKRLP
jgi:hypothetical protein